MKVSELKGAELDYWVAQAEGELRPRHELRVIGDYATDALPYSSDWAHGGPIVEREWINIRLQLEHWHGVAWPRSILCGKLDEFMRAYVGGKFGEIVPPESKL